MPESKRTQKLRGDLRELHDALRAETYARYQRINPFAEDLFDWKERGAFWLGEDKNVTIYNSATLIGDVSIGENTWVGPNCLLDGSGGLTIGRFCSLASGAQLLTHDTVKWALSGGKAEYEYAPTRIGDCCFIGTYAVITKGVTIGEHSLLGAGCVVTQENVPAYSVVAGVPAKIIGKVAIDADGNVEIIYH
jgi:acetyltransferase-like isoleucine patch superfamily enzyme